jgi:hypothetical protein
MESQQPGKPVSIFWLLAIGLIVVGAITNAGKNGSSPSPTSGKPYDMPEQDWVYATNRVQRGANVSRRDAETAARAIWKFEQNRKAREGR